MAGATRTKAKEDFEYLIDKVLDVKEDEEFNSVTKHNKINTIPDILQLSSRLLNKMEYKNSDGLSQSIPNYVDAIFCVIKQWNLHLMEKHNLTTVDWSDINIVNAESYDLYRTGTDFNPELSFQSLAISKPIAVKQHDNVAQNFQKGIKRDKAHYSILSDELNWNDWKRSTIATVFAHGCEDVINSKYVPSTTEHILLFQQQNRFMYDVFNKILKTIMGVNYVRKHETTMNAQLVWADYTNYMRTSTRADMELESLISSLTSLRITPSYKGSTLKFLVDWLENLRQYESMTDKSCHFSDPMKKSFLQNAVSNLKHFREVKLAESVGIAQSQGPIPYPNYVILLQSAATQFDKSNSLRQGNRQSLINQNEQNFIPDHFHPHPTTGRMKSAKTSDRSLPMQPQLLDLHFIDVDHPLGKKCGPS